MKRYISSVLMVVIILLSIGTYYINVASYASNLPELTFKKLEGDEDELKSVHVNGDYIDGRIVENFDMEVESNKIEYRTQLSYYEDMVRNYEPNDERLVNEYRSFMRGKEYNDSYYEDKDNLTFVTMDINYENRKYSSNFKIESLDKKNKEEKSFEIDVPDQDKYADISVRDVQFAQSKLQIITQNDVLTNDENDMVEIHHYTINLAGNKIVSDETILSETFDSSNQGHFAMPSKVVGKLNNVFIVALVKGSYSEEGEFKEKKAESSLFSYHYDTKELEKIKLPNDVDITYEFFESDFFFDEKNLYIKEQSDERTRIWTFDIVKQKIINDYTVERANSNSITIKDDRFLILTRKDDGNSTDVLLIADGNTGKTLYKGELVLDSDDQKKDTVQRIQLHDVYIK